MLRRPSPEEIIETKFNDWTNDLARYLRIGTFSRELDLYRPILREHTLKGNWTVTASIVFVPDCIVTCTAERGEVPVYYLKNQPPRKPYQFHD